MPDPTITVSIVSHRQNALVNKFLEDIQRYCADRVAVILTENVDDPTPLVTEPYFCSVERIANSKPKGFGANHNTAFARCRTPYFCVANPDIRLDADPFPRLVDVLTDQRVAAVGPRIVDADGHVQESARRYPTPLAIARKALGLPERPDYDVMAGGRAVDWIAGMFMLFRSEAFARIGGFDERYFLYYEDADICRRLRRAGYDVRFEPNCTATHLAQRSSHRDLRYLRWHMTSMLRFFLTR